jgi:hypothetical protein
VTKRGGVSRRIRRGHTALRAGPTTKERSVMIILGIILLLLGLLLSVPVLWVIGLVLVVIGAILWIAGSAGHEVGGRRHYY